MKYWLKVIQKTDNKFNNVIYKLMLRDFDNNAMVLNCLERHLLCSLGVIDVCLFQGVADNTVFLFIVKQLLHDQFCQSWHQNSKIHQGLYFIVIFQSLISKLFRCKNVRQFRVAVSKLRESSHRLEVETERWTWLNSTLLRKESVGFVEN